MRERDPHQHGRPDPGLRFGKASLLSGSWRHPEGTVMGGHSHCPFPGKTWILIRDIPCCPLETQPVVTRTPRGPRWAGLPAGGQPGCPEPPASWALLATPLGTQTLRQTRPSPQPALCPELVSGPTWNLDNWPGAQPPMESPLSCLAAPSVPHFVSLQCRPFQRALPSLPPSPSFVLPSKLVLSFLFCVHFFIF